MLTTYWPVDGAGIDGRSAADFDLPLLMAKRTLPPRTHHAPDAGSCP